MNFRSIISKRKKIMEPQISKNMTWIDIFKKKGRNKQINDEVKELVDALSEFNIDEKDNSDSLQTLTARSLDSVINLTEYEDQKANRILTAIAFLSALSGVMFSTLLPKYKDGTILLIKHWNWSVWLYYISFGLFVFSLIVGAALVIYALTPRFNNPPSWKEDKTDPGSLLFFEKILEIRPRLWAEYFKKNSFDDLQTKYIKGNIAESYIVSQKIREKLIPLMPGIRLLNIAVCLLIPWLFCCGFVISFSPTIENSANPLKSEIQNSAKKSADALKKADVALQSVEDCLRYGRSTIIASSRLNEACKRAEEAEWNAFLAEKKAKNAKNQAQNFAQKSREFYLKMKEIGK